MAKIFNIDSKDTIVLRPQHLFGRQSANVNTLLDNPSTSRLHASISWNGSNWLIQDTSSNGTFLNNERIVQGNKIRLHVGDKIQFGSNEAHMWQFNCDQAPKSLLVPLFDDSNPIELEGVIALPNEVLSDITLYQDTHSQWLVETQSGITQLESGDKVNSSLGTWVFIDADSVDSTERVGQIQANLQPQIKLNFKVSMNEEHVSLLIQFDQLQIDLGERAHHYLLLLLARKRYSDHQQGIDDCEQGWIDKDLLCQDTGLDEKHINLQIFRFRKQLIQANPSSMQLLQIIERRRGEIRCAISALSIIGGNTLLQQE